MSNTREQLNDFRDLEEWKQLTDKELKERTQQFEDCKVDSQLTWLEEKALWEKEQEEVDKLIEKLDDNCEDDLIEWLKEDKND